MARKVQVDLLDDIDGSQADETLKFGLDGVSYEIDLSARHAERLRASLAKFVLSSRRVGRGQLVAAARTRGAGPAKVDRAQNQAIRDWAKSKGIEISGRGRIPAGVVEQYQKQAGR
ncbi:MAG: nucleoid-associated protein Lsr2 [Actinobacteria bacterium 13_2_20CM_2_71_6]|nr:MAG: nucleoid-associated protein Lsr2 [Actinobacteria bacterium 13_2_20CM_2_71_6]